MEQSENQRTAYRLESGRFIKFCCSKTRRSKHSSRSFCWLLVSTQTSVSAKAYFSGLSVDINDQFGIQDRVFERVVGVLVVREGVVEVQVEALLAVDLHFRVSRRGCAAGGDGRGRPPAQLRCRGCRRGLGRRLISRRPRTYRSWFGPNSQADSSVLFALEQVQRLGSERHGLGSREAVAGSAPDARTTWQGRTASIEHGPVRRDAP
jgi:hypothetical protein